MIPADIDTQGRLYSRSSPSLMIVPQLTLGGCTPMDRNDREGSRMMLVAIISGRNTITPDTTVGRISEKISRRVDAPWATAASTNSLLTTASTQPGKPGDTAAR